MCGGNSQSRRVISRGETEYLDQLVRGAYAKRLVAGVRKAGGIWTERDALAVDGLMPEAGPPTALRSLALVDEMVRADRIDLARTYTNDLVRKARQKYSV